MEQMEYFSPDGKESGWYDKGKQPEGWTSEAPSIDADAQDDLEIDEDDQDTDEE